MNDSHPGGEPGQGTAKASRRRFFGGDSVQQALVQAANYFHLDPEEIAYRVLDKRHGFLKVRRKVVLEVDADAPRRPPGAPVAEASGEGVVDVVAAREAALARVARSLPVSDPDDDRGNRAVRDSNEEDQDDRGNRLDSGEHRERGNQVERVPQSRGRSEGVGRRERGGRGRSTGDRPGRRHSGEEQPAYAMSWDESLVRLRERPVPTAERFAKAEGASADAAAHGISLLLRIASLDLRGEVYQGADRLEVDLKGADSDWCFADDGEFLMAVEHLLPRVIRSLSGESVACQVDCDNFHDLREERLRTLAQKVAQEVRQLGKPRMLAAMNPADRRIVHTTLADDPGVATESMGDGYFKRITIRPIPV